MPTTVYTKHKEKHTISHAGKEYQVENGQADVADDAVPVLVESHGFSASPFKDETDETETETPIKNKGGRPPTKAKAE
jgi:hypothetical protein